MQGGHSVSRVYCSTRHAPVVGEHYSFALDSRCQLSVVQINSSLAGPIALLKYKQTRAATLVADQVDLHTSAPAPTGRHSAQRNATHPLALLIACVRVRVRVEVLGGKFLRCTRHPIALKLTRTTRTRGS